MLVFSALLILGFIILIKGANFLSMVHHSLQGNMVFPTWLTVVAFGTSMPELIVSLMAALTDQNDASFGNVIGSNNFNLLFILGVSGLIFPLSIQRNTVKYEIPLSILAAIVLFLLVNDSLLWSAEENIFSRLDGVLLLGMFAAFLFYVYKTMTGSPELSEEVTTKNYGFATSVALAGLGLVMSIGGGKLVVDNAISIANYYGLSEKLIGLTILAAGTSLPELATSAVAAYRKKYRHRHRQCCWFQHFQYPVYSWDNRIHSTHRLQHQP